MPKQAAPPECPICYRKVARSNISSCMELMCRHIYHRTCLMKWMMQSSTCPMCRQRIQEVINLADDPDDPDE